MPSQTTDMLTLEEISLLVGVSKPAVSVRLSKHGIVRNSSMQSSGGRCVSLFIANQALAVFGKKLVHGELMPLNQEPKFGDDGEKNRKSRNDRGATRNAPCGLTDEIIKSIIDKTLENYLNQGLRDNIQRSAIKATQEILGLSERDDDFQKIVRYIYQKRIMRKDEYFVGAKWTPIDWCILWDNKRKVNQMNTLMPKLSWDFYELFESAGLCKRGSGAGLVWIIDASQYDVWVKMPGANGKTETRTVSFLLIIDGLTKFPLWLRPLLKGESITEAIEAIKDCVSIYGAPRYGVVADNGSAFVSPRFKGFLKTVCREKPDESARKVFKSIFPNSEFPLYLPGRKMPASPLKSLVEATFNQINKIPAELEPEAYQGGTASRRNSYELGTTPVHALKHAPLFQDSWIEFALNIWNDYANSVNGKIHRMMVAKGLKQAWSIADAFEYYGGDSLAALNWLGLPITSTERYLNPTKNNYALLPADFENDPLAIFYACDSIGRHKLDSCGQVIIRKNNVNYNFHCLELNASFLDKQISYVIIQELDRVVAYFYLEYNPKLYNELTPNKDDIYFIGKGDERTVKRLSDIQHMTRKRADNQKHQVRYLSEMTPVYLEKDKQLESTPEIEIPKLDSNIEIDDILNF